MKPQTKSIWRHIYLELMATHSASVSDRHTPISECSQGAQDMNFDFDLVGYSTCFGGGVWFASSESRCNDRDTLVDSADSISQGDDD